jgi:hypothetical protein
MDAIMAEIRRLIAEKKYDAAIDLANKHGLGKNANTGHYELWYKDLMKSQKKNYNARMGRVVREETLPYIEYVARIPSERYKTVPVGNLNRTANLGWASAAAAPGNIWIPPIPSSAYGRAFYPERASKAGAGNLEAKMEALKPTVKPTGVKTSVLNTMGAKLGFFRGGKQTRRRKNKSSRKSRNGTFSRRRR